jgi:NTE family protein
MVWPARDLRIPAVEAATGEEVIFTRDSGVALLDAVAASCAVPGIWPPVSIDDRRYIDGGVRSSTNVDLASDADHILLISPTIPDTPAPSLGGNLHIELDTVSNSHVEIIYADRDSMRAVGNPLAVDTRAQAAEAAAASAEPLPAGSLDCSTRDPA